MTIYQYADHVEQLHREYLRLKKLADQTESASFEKHARDAKGRWQRARNYLKRRKRGVQ